MIRESIVQAFLKEFSDGLLSIVLFGSRARRDGHSFSDWDILLVTNGNLPENPLDRQWYLKDILSKNAILNVSIMAKTKEEFESRLAAVYLDIALDGIILFDRNKYMEKKLEEIRQILKKSGLKRIKKRHGLVWRWDKGKHPKPGAWKIEWRASESTGRCRI